MLFPYPSGAWTSTHQMTLNGKRDGFSLEDFRAGARTASMKRGRAETILAEVGDAVTRWPEFAQAAAVPDSQMVSIRRALRLQPFE